MSKEELSEPPVDTKEPLSDLNSMEAVDTSEPITAASSSKVDSKEDTTNVSYAVDISDALSERDWVKFTVHTKKINADNEEPEEFSVIRLHEEFLWLQGTLVENETYAGLILPPAPPRPDFDVSKEKLRRLGDAEANLSKGEFNKLKTELEAEYLAQFKKTVAMHETFLTRIASHPVLKHDENFHVFLQYDKELAVRGKNRKEKLVNLFSSLQKSSDELLLSTTMKDVDDNFEKEKLFLVNYHAALKDCTIKSDKMAVAQKALADNYIALGQVFYDLSNQGKEADHECNKNGDGDLKNGEEGKTINNSCTKDESAFFLKLAETMEKKRRVEARVASDQDLKLSDTLRYHAKDTIAAKDLIYRRLRALANYESSNKNLEKARIRNRDVPSFEDSQQKACENFEALSSKAKEELKALHEARGKSFEKNLREMAELQLKHARAHSQMLKSALSALEGDVK